MGSSAASEKEYYNAPVLQNHFQRNMHFISTVHCATDFLVSHCAVRDTYFISKS